MLDWKHVGFLFAKASPSHISSKGTNKSHISKSGTIRSPTLGRRKLAFYLSLGLAAMGHLSCSSLYWPVTSIIEPFGPLYRPRKYLETS